MKHPSGDRLRTSYQMLTINDGGGNVIYWNASNIYGIGLSHLIETTVNTAEYVKILDDQDPKQTSRATGD
uniref:DUF4224 domain-containing protein n=1 Tax=Heterorhabditis bacteriophora TaxID=37862 RepID=A0A1I7X817_HETBA